MFTKSLMNEMYEHLNRGFIAEYLRTQAYGRDLSVESAKEVAATICETNEGFLPSRPIITVGKPGGGNSHILWMNDCVEPRIRLTSDLTENKTRCIAYVSYYFERRWDVLAEFWADCPNEAVCWFGLASAEDVWTMEFKRKNEGLAQTTDKTRYIWRCATTRRNQKMMDYAVRKISKIR